MARGYPADALIVVAGIPGAGKSTLLARISAQPAAGRTRILDSQQVRELLPAALRRGFAYGLLRPLVHTVHWGRVVLALGSPGALLVHETATRSASRAALAGLARVCGRSAHLLWVSATPEEARLGQSRRARVVASASQERHERRWSRLQERLGTDGGFPGFASSRVVSRQEAARLLVVADDQVLITRTSTS